MPIKRNMRLHLLAGLILVVMTASVFTQYLISHKTLRSKNDQVMQTFIQQEIDNTNGWLREHGQIITLAGALIPKNSNQDAHTLDILKTFLESGRGFTTLYFGTPDNRMINASAWKMPPGFDLRTRPWYLAALRSGGLTTTPVFLNASKDKLIITICKAIYYPSGILQGVIAGDIALDSLIGQIAIATPAGFGFSFVASTDGRLLAHSSILSNRNPLDLKLPHPNYAPIMTKLVQLGSGSLEISIGQEEGLLVFKKIISLDLIIAAFVPNSHIDKALEPLRLTFIAVIIVSFSLWGAFFWYQRRHIDLPLVLLEQGIKAINPDARPWYRLPTIPSSDFGPIVQTVNGILDRIEVYYSDKNIAEAALRKSLNDREALLKEVHHRVKNNMQIVVSLLETQAEYQRDPDSIEALKKIAQRVHSMAIVHEELYRADNLSQISFGPFARRIISSLTETLDQNHRIQWTVEDNAKGLDLVKAIPCGLILNELIANAIKHAFPHNKKGTIAISLNTLQDITANKQFMLVIADDGCGLPEGFTISSTPSFGLQLVSILCKQLKADLTLDRNKGTRYTILF